MTAPINTFVDPDPTSCRAGAAELTKLQKGTQDVTTAMSRVSSESESCWVGSAGDNFRQLMRKNATESGELEESIRKSAMALNTFADEITSVIGQMQRAREHAASAGLLLSMHQILPPGNPPTRPSPSPTLYELPIDYLNAKAAYDKKVTAFNEAAEMVSAARSDQQRATNALMGALNYEKNLPERMVPGSFALLGAGHALVTSPQSAADRLASRANAAAIRAAAAQKTLANPNISPVERAAATRTIATQTKSAITAGRAAESNKLIAQRLHRRVGMSPQAQRIAGSAWAKKAPLFSKITKGGTITTVAGGVVAWKAGKPADEATASVVGSLIGGGLGAHLTAGLVPVSMSGGPVTVIAAGVGGVVFGALGSWGGEELYEYGKETFS